MIRKAVMLGLVAAVGVGMAHGADDAARKPLTEDGGQPVGNNQNSRTAGIDGPVLLDNFHLIQKIARFDRERTPERVVHARGVGAHGEFVSYGDFSNLTKATVLSAKGKVTPVFTRFSTVIHPNGSPEQLRDPRGFAVKFYAEEGNWDIVGNNLPVFFIRDAMKFPDMVHSLKPSPITNQQDPNRFFDFFSHIPEATHMLTFLFSDQGTPANLRQMDGFGVHAFKFVNSAGEVTYVKFNWHSMQGLANFTGDEPGIAMGKNFSGHTRDLYDHIKKGEFPSWELGVQTIKPSDLDKFAFNPLDATKVWTGVPEIKVGKMTLNKVPDNFFEFTESVAYSPAMVIPGVEASEDRLLQGRLFSYADTQRYRLGTNYLMLPVNRPVVPVSNNNQAGSGDVALTHSDTNYEPSVTTGTGPGDRRDTPEAESSKAPLVGPVVQQPITKTLNFQQAGELYRSFTSKEKDALITNLTGALTDIKTKEVLMTMLSYFYQADADYGTRLAKGVQVDPAAVRTRIQAGNAKPSTTVKTTAR